MIVARIFGCLLLSLRLDDSRAGVTICGLVTTLLRTGGMEELEDWPHLPFGTWAVLISSCWLLIWSGVPLPGDHVVGVVVVVRCWWRSWSGLHEDTADTPL